MKAVITSLFLVVFFIQAWAQQDSVQVSLVLSMPSYNSTDVSDFHEYMDEERYFVNDYWPWGVGVGAGLEYKRFNLDLTGTMNFTQKETIQDTTFSSQFGVIAFELSYSVFDSENLRLHPFVGFRSTLFRYESKVDQTYSDLADYLESPELNREMQFQRSYLSVGIGIEFGQNERIGVRSGLYVPVNKGQWKMNDFTLTDNIPSMRSLWYVGLYVRLGGVKFNPKGIFK